MRRQQAGFTLIELIAVMVILGILAATATARFVDFGGDAAIAAIENIAGTIESSSSINHTLDIANEAGATTDTPVTVSACTLAVVNSLLVGGGLDAADYTVTGAATIADKATEICTINGPYTGTPNDTATFALIGAN